MEPKKIPIELIWLSIHRAKKLKKTENDFESTVDQRISELQEQFTQYELTIKKDENDALNDFQKEFLLSIFNMPKFQRLFSDDGRNKVDENKKSIIEIYNKFGVTDRKLTQRVDSFYKRATELFSKISTEKRFSMDDVLTLSTFWNLLNIKKQWDDTQNEVVAINAHKDLFFKILNGLFHYKTMYSDNGRIRATTKSDTIIELNKLSSGEKQIFILLAEAFFRKDKQAIYIADEPELSLHIDWQESLISNIRRLNKTTQILFATHSPDIVSEYDDKTFDMEDLIERGIS